MGEEEEVEEEVVVEEGVEEEIVLEGVEEIDLEEEGTGLEEVEEGSETDLGMETDQVEEEVMGAEEEVMGGEVEVEVMVVVVVEDTGVEVGVLGVAMKEEWVVEVIEGQGMEAEIDLIHTNNVLLIFAGVSQRFFCLMYKIFWILPINSDFGHSILISMLCFWTKI